MNTVNKFATKSQCDIADKISQEIADVFAKYEGQIPFALALGILRIFEKELFDKNDIYEED